MTAETLIIIDMLNDFIDPRGVLFCGEPAQRVVPVIRERLDRYRAAGAAVIYLQDAHSPDDKEFEKFPPHCIAGTWGSEIIGALSPRPEEHVLPKTRYSGFYGTDLDNVLVSLAGQQVEVTGVCTSICVMDTVGGLVNRDYQVRVPREGVADFDARAHDFALERMEKIYGVRIV